MNRAAQFTEYFKIYYKNNKNMNEKKSSQKLFILTYVIKRFKTS